MLRLCHKIYFASGKKLNIPFNFKLPSEQETTHENSHPKKSKEEKIVIKKIKRQGLEKFGLKKV